MHTHAHKKSGILRLASVACAVVAVAALPPVASAATPPPGLGGKALSESDPTITNCPAPGSPGSFSYEASGNATGSYAGTFTETGTITVGYEDSMGRQRVTGASIQFSITSPTGSVTGTKTYVPTGDPSINPALAKCWYDWNGMGGSVGISYDDLRYSATITTTDGQTCTQSGGSTLSLVDNSPVLRDSFSETFLNDATAPITCTGGEPEMPASKEDCMDGGWAGYGFRNQGECIAWVNHNLL
jgi:hypothetical protein